MTIFAAQYLESLPEGATPADVRRRLRQAFERLPISLILSGWDLPSKFEEAIAEETARHGASLFRWQPWLTGDAHTDLPPEWFTIGPDGNPIPGHNNAPDFTFVCPNRSGVADFLSERLESIAARGLYQGIFLDRIRFPSPAPGPTRFLGCFCKHCARLAADAGLDLEMVRQILQFASVDKNGGHQLIRSLLGNPDSPTGPLEAFLDFRAQSITRIVAAVKRQADSLGLSLGLDCFSPALTRMVGQDLQSLDKVSDWIKLMIYPRVLGPAGLPFELADLALWLGHHGWTEEEALGILSEAMGLTIPETIADLRQAGLGSDTMAKEIQRGRTMSITRLLAGVAMVNLKGIHWAAPEQIQNDLQAARAADGLVISWDLWFTPLEHLDTIRKLWM
jgi:hypothetical protein